jgi:hypothetical protein
VVTDLLARVGTFARTPALDSVAVTDSLVKTKVANRTIALDSVAVTDQLVRSLTASKVLADTVAVADQVARTSTFNRAASDAVSVTDEVLAELVISIILRNVSDTVAVSDSLSRVLTANRAAQDSVLVSDTSARTKTAYRAVADAVVVTDLVIRAASLARVLTDSVAVSDAVARTLTAYRAMNDAVSITDAVSRVATFNRVLADTVAVIDDIIAMKGAFQNVVLSDTVAVTDTIARAAQYLRTLSDSTIVGDDVHVDLMRTISRTISDSTAVSDTVARSRWLYRTSNDIVSTADLLVKTLTAVRTVSDTVSVSDTVTKTRTAARTASDTVAVTDVAAKVLTAARTVSDTAVVGDTVSRTLTANRSSADTVAVSDAAVRTKTALRASTDTVGVADQVVKTKTALRSATDTVAVVDQTARTKIAGRLVEDSVLVVDNAALAKSFVRTLVDAIVATDAVARTSTFNRTVDDVVLVSDGALVDRMLERNLSDTVDVVDVLAMNYVMERYCSDVVVVTDLVEKTFSGHQLSAQEIAQAVWNAAHVDYLLAGTMGWTQLMNAYQSAIGPAVYMDMVDGTAGAVLGLNGTRSHPVSNEADMVAIAAQLQIKRVMLVGGELLLTRAYEGWEFSGLASSGNPEINVGGQYMQDSKFERVDVEGIFADTTTGESCTFRDCHIGPAYGITGRLYNCTLRGEIEVGKDATSHPLACGILKAFCCSAAGEADEGPVTLLCGAGPGVHARDIQIMGWAGMIEVHGMSSSGTRVHLECNSGHVAIKPSCTAGNITLSGVVHVIDESVGAVVDAMDTLCADELMAGTAALVAEHEDQVMTHLRYLIESQRTGHNAYGECFYWDPVDGDDLNDGKLPSRPRKTFASIQSALVVDGRRDVVFVVGTGEPTTITERIVIDKAYLSLRGSGRSVVFAPTSDAGPTITIDAHGVEIANFKVTTAQGGAAVYGIHGTAANCTNAHLSNLDVYECTDCGIFLEGGSTNIVDGSLVHNNGGSGVNFKNTLGAKVQRSIVINNGGYGVKLEEGVGGNCLGTVIDDCLVKWNNPKDLSIGSGVFATVVRANCTLDPTKVDSAGAWYSHDETAQRDRTVDATWDEPVAGHVTASTFGAWINAGSPLSSDQSAQLREMWEMKALDPVKAYQSAPTQIRVGSIVINVVEGPSGTFTATRV